MSLYIDADYMQEADDHPMWQESWVLIFGDNDAGIYGFLRIGTYVNQGISQVHWGLSTKEGLRFRRHRLDIPLQEGDRTREKVTAGSMSYSIPNGEYVRFEAHDPDCDLDLRLFDYFQSEPWHVENGGLDDMAKNHFESAGRVEGTIRIGDRHFDVRNGYGLRDHSWGKRISAGILNSRWYCGSFGEALSFSCTNVQVPSGDFIRAGFVARNGVIEHAKTINTAVTVLLDTVSVVGGVLVIELESGEIIRIEGEAVDGIITSSHLPNGGPGSTPAGCHAMSVAKWNGMEGFIDLGSHFNALNGESAITATLMADMGDGISHRDPDVLSWLRASATN